MKATSPQAQASSSAEDQPGKTQPFTKKGMRRAGSHGALFIIFVIEFNAFVSWIDKLAGLRKSKLEEVWLID